VDRPDHDGGDQCDEYECRARQACQRALSQRRHSLYLLPSIHIATKRTRSHRRTKETINQLVNGGAGSGASKSTPLATGHGEVQSRRSSTVGRRSIKQASHQRIAIIVHKRGRQGSWLQLSDESITAGSLARINRQSPNESNGRLERCQVNAVPHAERQTGRRCATHNDELRAPAGPTRFPGQQGVLVRGSVSSRRRSASGGCWGVTGCWR